MDQINKPARRMGSICSVQKDNQVSYRIPRCNLTNGRKVKRRSIGGRITTAHESASPYENQSTSLCERGTAIPEKGRPGYT